MARHTTLEERIQIIEYGQAGMTTMQIAQQTGWQPSTIRKWQYRARRQGRKGLVSKMGRPKRGALSSFPTRVRERLRDWCHSHPGWGPKTLAAELRRDPDFADQRLPSLASIGRFLKEEGETKRYEQHSHLPESTGQKASAPHETWEMDARGHDKVPDLGIISLINLNDRFTHLRLLSYPLQVGTQRVERYGDTEDYQTVLRLAFTDWGLPQQIQVDRDSVFFDNKSKSPYPTRIHLWLLALGVSLTFGRPRRPTDQGQTERSHQIWAAQSLEGQQYESWTQLYLALRARRQFLNEHLPCSALDELPPLQAFPQAKHSGRCYRPEWEAQLLDLQRIYAYLAKGRWFRLISKSGTFSLGREIYYLDYHLAQSQIEINFDAADQHLVCFAADGELIKRLPLKGLNIETLMGSFLSQLNLPLFQLHLPLDWQSLRALRLFEIFPTTT
jgi:transposase